MPRTADVVVVGDGVVGASIAYHLAAAGSRVALLARDGAFAHSATRHSAGQVRMHHSDPHDARLAALSLATFEQWPQLIGGDCGFRRTGFAFLVGEEHAGALTQSVKELTELGVITSELSPGAFADEQPALDLTGVAAVAYEPRSGYADPGRTAAALADRARALGAVVVSGRAGARLCRSGDLITGAVAGDETFSAGQVVVAAGAGSAGVCADAGAGIGDDGPGLPLRGRQFGWAVADSSAMPGADRLCMIIDDTAGTYFRPHGPGRVLFRIPLEPTAVPEGSTRVPVDAEEIGVGRALAARRLRGITAAPLVDAARADEAYTDDGRALIGPVGCHPGLYLATGFNGGGFKTAPAVGRAVAAELTTGAQRPELGAYRPDRFAAGRPSPTIQRYRHM
ncbi:NAD(P)/FAD-dependent oxidoreductase [Streptomyces pinistramenti]|uniref:NAD(P)/FAD-dependent oxidoreductase n=1 Tax=Streptomyces pinistramenti TaxID=2884812 RepID=UPI001D0807E2|nr:FAD-binding oxidoreductase [Streptomyces pinistramenti]MCB5912215.1 FAD-binding oxidoreductase [Streptomyces pinistramenti]